MAHVKFIHTVLIANRGEIALRIQKTAKEMGYKTVAVYSDGDANELFVRSADIAIPLQGQTSADTYLNVDKIIRACEISGANAVHPGYGFLSENADFAQSVIDAGLIWVGPSPDAIEKMGDKLSAKKLMEIAKVPTLSGIEVKAEMDYSKLANELGFPVLIKASAGGGGKGMRVVEKESELQAAVESAQREALAAFGDETVFLEKWLTSTRHIEVQILGDEHGNLVHCFERECSIQRRHQKVIEEAPSAAVSNDLRHKMGEAAVSAAKSIGYHSTGTVEFLLSGEEFYFLEVNTRLQVEHPVTEMITGLDLVREQFRVAEGNALEFTQEDLCIKGHAIEARLYAEDPSNQFLPSPGRVLNWEPAEIAGVRYDTGVASGSEIGIDFDPMVAKVIAYSPTRREAALKLARALATTKLQGITSNKDFLVETLNTPEFLSADTTTDFIERVNPPRKSVLSSETIRSAAIAVSLVKRWNNQQHTQVLVGIPRGWTNTLMPLDSTDYSISEQKVTAGYQLLRNGDLRFFVNDDPTLVRVHSVNAKLAEFSVEGIRHTWELSNKEGKWFVESIFGSIEIEEHERFLAEKEAVKEGDLTAPMPSVVRKVCVEVGDEVEKGETLLLLESMKMELQVKASNDGVVAEIKVKKGSNVETGQILVSIASEQHAESVEREEQSPQETEPA